MGNIITDILKYPSRLEQSTDSSIAQSKDSFMYRDWYTVGQATVPVFFIEVCQVGINSLLQGSWMLS